MTVQEAIKNCEMFTQTYDLFSTDLLSIDTLIDFAESKEKYKWHDLRKDPTDLPKNEVEVEIAYKAYECIQTTRAIYEDGTMHSEDSDWCYMELDEWCEYCEETDDYIIAQGWLETVHFAEYMGVIDREVIAWKEIEPFEEVEE